MLAFSGYYAAQTTVVMAELIGVDQVAAGMGLINMTGAVGGLIGNPLGGACMLYF